MVKPPTISIHRSVSVSMEAALQLPIDPADLTAQVRRLHQFAENRYPTYHSGGVMILEGNCRGEIKLHVTLTDEATAEKAGQ